MSNLMGVDFDYVVEFVKIDLDELQRDIEEVMIIL